LDICMWSRATALGCVGFKGRIIELSIVRVIREVRFEYPFGTVGDCG